MALTLLTTPGQYYSAHGNLLFVVKDAEKAADPVMYPDFRYVADIYLAGLLVTRQKVYPRPDTLLGIFDVGGVVRNYVANNFNPAAAALVAQTLANPDWYTEVVVKFGEEYNFALYPDLIVDTARRYFSHYNTRGSLPTALAGYTNKALSVRPTTGQVLANAAFNFVPAFVSSGTPTAFITYYSASNGILGYSVFGGTPPADTALLFNVTTTVVTGIPVGNIAYYTFTYGSQIYRFDIINECRYQPYTLHFLNRFGHFESKAFSKLSRRSFATEKQEYGRLRYAVDGAGVASYANGNGVQYEQRVVYAKQYTEKLLLNTDILSDAEYQWLADLVLSPQVYLEDNGQFVPVVIADSNYEPRKVVQDKLTNLQLTVEFGYEGGVQSR